MREMDPFVPAERIDDPPSMVAYWDRRGRLIAVATGFAFPIGAVALLLGGVSLLEGQIVGVVVLWLATLLAALLVLLAGIEALLAYRLVRWRRSEIGAYDYAWIERAQREQPAVGEMARQCLVERGAVPVAELVRMWRVYVREQRKTAGERRRHARRHCAQQLGLRPKQAASTEGAEKAGNGAGAGEGEAAVAGAASADIP